jgi:hypothetical protein
MRNKPLHESSVLICGTARNVETKIPNFVLGVNRCFSGFKSVNILIVESFSSDKTIEALSKQKNTERNFDYFTDDTVDKGESRRTVRIASARSSVQNWIRNQAQVFDYVVMADMDGVNKDLTRIAVESCWQSDEWDVVTASQPFKYYDLWALRAKGWCEKDCWEEYDQLRLLYGDRKAKKMAITSKMKGLPRSSPWVEVDSAFGGLAIYKTEAFLSGAYSGTNPKGIEICEHVPLHQDIKTHGYRIFINPNLVNISPSRQILGIIKSWLTRDINSPK